MRLNHRGSVLIIAYSVLFILLMLGGIFFSRTLTDMKLFNINRERLEAFYLSEAGANRAMAELRANYNGYMGTGATACGRGEYETSVATLSGTSKQILAYGYIPSKAQARTRRSIEMITKKYSPPNFYDYALYAADDVNINGSSYSVTGKVIYADTTSGTIANICNGGVCGTAPTVTKDPAVSPLAHFDFAILRGIAASQFNPNTANNNNIYTLQDLNNKATFPTSFWYTPPTVPGDPTTGVPNVVYVEGNIEFKNANTSGKKAGGFYIVVGTDPTVTFDTSLNGNILIDGCIYTTGTFTNSGGGNQADVNGGVWAGTDVNLSGSIDITYNLDFMMAIKNVVEINGASGALQVLSWRELN